MRLAELDYPLPEELIAQEPAPERDAARLLVAARGQPTRHAHVRELPAVLRAGDLLVLNDTRVIAARVRGRRPSGGRLELLFVQPRADGEFQAAQRLADAAAIMAKEPITVQLRFLQTLVEIASENNSTTVFPIPIDLLRPFLERRGP